MMLQRFAGSDNSTVLQEHLLPDVTVAQALASLESHQSALDHNKLTIGSTRIYSTGVASDAPAIAVS
jgi:hypothetical protein